MNHIRNTPEQMLDLQIGTALRCVRCIVNQLTGNGSRSSTAGLEQRVREMKIEDLRAPSAGPTGCLCVPEHVLGREKARPSLASSKPRFNVPHTKCALKRCVQTNGFFSGGQIQEQASAAEKALPISLAGRCCCCSGKWSSITLRHRAVTT